MARTKDEIQADARANFDAQTENEEKTKALEAELKAWRTKSSIEADLKAAREEASRLNARSESLLSEWGDLLKPAEGGGE